MRRAHFVQIEWLLETFLRTLGIMAMKGIVYISRALVPFDAPSLQDLAADAATRNSELEVTGYLCFEEGRFIQYIEGEPATVTGLMAKIAKDQRHTVLSQAEDDNVTERRFPSWSMRWIQRGSFAGLERLLASHLALMKPEMQANAWRATWENSVWKTVDRLSELRATLAKSA